MEALQDLNFVLDHVDDLDAVIKVEGGETIVLPTERCSGKQTGLPLALDPQKIPSESV